MTFPLPRECATSAPQGLIVRTFASRLPYGNATSPQTTFSCFRRQSLCAFGLLLHKNELFALLRSRSFSFLLLRHFLTSFVSLRKILHKGSFYIKWAEVDSNHRRLASTDLQSVAFSHSAIYPFIFNF